MVLEMRNKMNSLFFKIIKSIMRDTIFGLVTAFCFIKLADYTISKFNKKIGTDNLNK